MFWDQQSLIVKDDFEAKTIILTKLRIICRLQHSMKTKNYNNNLQSKGKDIISLWAKEYESQIRKNETKKELHTL